MSGIVRYSQKRTVCNEVMRVNLSVAHRKASTAIHVQRIPLHQTSVRISRVAREIRINEVGTAFPTCSPLD